jgi:hypothetical protein
MSDRSVHNKRTAETLEKALEKMCFQDSDHLQLETELGVDQERSDLYEIKIYIKN